MRCAHPDHIGGRLLAQEDFPVHEGRADALSPFCHSCTARMAEPPTLSETTPTPGRRPRVASEEKETP